MLTRDCYGVAAAAHLGAGDGSLVNAMEKGQDRTLDGVTIGNIIDQIRGERYFFWGTISTQSILMCHVVCLSPKEGTLKSLLRPSFFSI